MNPLIGVVIPVYNVELYLRTCIDSILSQTYSNYEVVLVDDGSTDDSGKICDEYASKDPRIKVFHKKNGGLSDARNYGVAHSEADLISFIDSDDYVTEDYLEYLWHLMDKYNSDISGALLKRVDEGQTFSLKNDNISESVLDAGQSLEQICCTSFASVGRLYKKQILLKHEFPVGKLYEDIATVYKLICECSVVAFSDKQIYVWVQRKGSITHSGINERQLDIFWALDELYNYTCENFSKYKNAADYRYVMETIEFIGRAFNNCKATDSRKYFKIARNNVLAHLKGANKCNSSTFRYKLASLCIYLGYFPYRVLYELRRLQKIVIVQVQGRKSGKN